MKYLIVLICIIHAGLASHALAVEPRTGAFNEHEIELRRISLPQFNKFNGQPVDRYVLFHWLAQEAKANDPAKEKVQFSILLSPESDLVQPKATTPSFLTASTNENGILLPDAVKYYASLCGLIYEFKPNCIEVRLPKE